MQLLEALAAVLPAYGDADPGEFLDELMIHTGLLRQKSRSSYDFVHLTFFKAVRGIDGREYPCERPISARSALLGLPQRLRLEKKTD
jgi:hypothetical protein